MIEALYFEAQIDTKFVEHYFRVMKNVTITMTEEVAQWARVEAARRGISLSRMLGEMLQESMERDAEYRTRHAAFNSVDPRPLTGPDRPLPTREQLHDRAGLR